MVKVTKDGVAFVPAPGFKGIGNYTLDRAAQGRTRRHRGDDYDRSGQSRLKAASLAVTSPLTSG